MLTTLKCRLYPNASQVKLLEKYIEESRRTFNLFLEQRIHAVKPDGKGFNLYDQQKQLTLHRQVISSVPADVQRDGLRRVDSAFKHFFERCKSKAKRKGFPRFKSKVRYNSFTVTGNGCRVRNGKPEIVGIKKPLRCRGLQPVAGQIKRITVKRKAGKWFGRILVENHQPAPEKKPIVKSIGIDVGLNAFIATSAGQTAECPKHYRRLQPALKRAQRLVSRRNKGSKRRGRALLNLQRVHEKIENCREDFLHKLSKQLINDFDLIATEKLNIKGMVRFKLAKSILDAGWGRFNWMLEYKAEKAGATFIQVNPSGTSQECSQCGEIVRKDLSVRVHSCPNCGLVLDRDVNAARNVLKRATDKTDAACAGNARRELTATALNVSELQVGSMKCVASF